MLDKLKEQRLKEIREKLVHKEGQCPLVARRISCLQCGYPVGEALFPSIVKYLECLR